MAVSTGDVQEFIESYWRPRIQADGGEMRFVSYEPGVLTVKMQAECSRCPIVDNCFKSFIEEDFEKKFGETIKLEQVIDKPYFMDM